MLAYLAHHELGSKFTTIIVVHASHVGLPEHYPVLLVGLHAHG